MRRIVRYFLVIITLMFIINIYSITNFKNIYRSMYDVFIELGKIHDIYKGIDEAYRYVGDYTHSGTIDYLNKYQIKIQELNIKITALSKKSNPDKVYYIYTDIRNMILTFDEKTQNIVNDFNTYKAPIYINQSMEELFRIKGYIHDEINKLINLKLENLEVIYESLKSNITSNELLAYIATILISLLCVLISLRFSKQISKPIHSLVLKLQKVGEGVFEEETIKNNYNDEITHLINSFNYMSKRIQELIEQIQIKGNIEAQLKEEKIKNLEIISLLNQTELKFLQAQINPHFLYNTLNAIGILSDIEEAPQTKKMIECLSDIFKYNLKKLDETVTLQEECDIINNYIYIQRLRFGDRLSFTINTDSAAMDYKIPGMILQPLVENALIHGLEPKLGSGALLIDIKKLEHCVCVTIKDDGVGIPEYKLTQLNDIQNVKGISTNESLGVINVKKRLALRYGKDIVNINSLLGEGTTIKINFPI
jgi:two-component system, sensor histidine kinase YesM